MVPVAPEHMAHLAQTQNMYVFLLSPRGMKQRLVCVRVRNASHNLPQISITPPMGTVEDANFILIPDVKSVLSDLADSWGTCKDL